jgi:hypothetical protein
MPSRVLATWEENVRFLDHILKSYQLDLFQIYLHWHKDPDLSHYCGVTYIDEKRMAFCTGNDKETMLHEVAHLKYGVPDHNEKWANHLIDLHHAHLKGVDLKKADAELVRDYKNAEKAYKKRFGTLPGPVKRKPRASVDFEGE